MNTIKRRLSNQKENNSMINLIGLICSLSVGLMLLFEKQYGYSCFLFFMAGVNFAIIVHQILFKERREP